MIRFTNLRPHPSEYQLELEAAVLRVIRSGTYLLGPELESFEAEFSRYLGLKHVVGVGSGTDALTLAVKALGLGKDDEVIVPANAYPTVFGVAAAATPRLCDVDPETFTISAASVLPALTKHTKAIVAVHLYGMPAPMAEIRQVAKAAGIFVIEDCAQAVGAAIAGKPAGTFGDISCFSFYPTKNLAAMGDGGAVATNSGQLSESVKQLRMYGEDTRYHSLVASAHSRLDEVQTAILRIRLKYLGEELKVRRGLLDRYRRHLPGNMLVPKNIPADVLHSGHLAVIKSPRRDELKRFLREKNIETAIHYPSPIHLQPAFLYLGYKTSDFPIAQQACRQVLSLPLHPGLAQSEQEQVIEAVTSFMDNKQGHDYEGAVESYI